MSLLFNFAFSFKTRIPEEIIVQNLIERSNPTQKDTEMFIVLVRKTCPGLYENILNFYKALSYKSEWPLLF